MKKHLLDGQARQTQNEAVLRVYRVYPTKINTSKTIHAQPIDSKTALYRSATSGRVLWGERS